MIVLYTICSNIQQYALIDVQLNEKNPGYWQKYPETQTTPKNPDLVEKPSCGNTAYDSHSKRAKISPSNIESNLRTLFSDSLTILQVNPT